MENLLKEFRAFLTRGNIVDLAVAVVIGIAFGAVVTAVVDGIINPIVGLVGGKNLDQYVITLDENDDGSGGVFLAWGHVLSEAINFVLVAAAVFFLVVKPMNMLQARRRQGEESAEATPAPSDEAVLLSEIRDLLRTQRT